MALNNRQKLKIPTSSHDSLQNHLSAIAPQDFEQIRIIPAGFGALGFDADLGGFLLVDQVQCHMTDHG